MGCKGRFAPQQLNTKSCLFSHELRPEVHLETTFLPLLLRADPLASPSCALLSYQATHLMLYIVHLMQKFESRNIPLRVRLASHECHRRFLELYLAQHEMPAPPLPPRTAGSLVCHHSPAGSCKQEFRAQYKENKGENATWILEGVALGCSTGDRGCT